MATQAEIQAWATAIGLPVCVGTEYAAEHNGALPPNIDALVSWGNSTGRRDAAGGWTCKGAGNTPVGGIEQIITDVVTKHPIIAGAGAVFIVLLFLKGGKR